MPGRPSGADVDLGIRGRTAVVCGSTRGLGRACAEALAAEGVAVVVNGRHEDSAAEAAAAIADRFGTEAHGVAADLSDSAGRQRLLAACSDPDILVTNNAGPPPAVFTDVSAEAWANALQANMLGAIELVQGVLPGMRARRFGRIVNITSINGQKGQIGQTNYSAAKAGVIGFTKALAQENAKKGITVNAIAPGYIDTEMVMAVPQNVLDQIISNIPVGRLGRAEEIARCVAFLSSEEAGFITGSTITVNGGQYISG